AASSKNTVTRSVFAAFGGGHLNRGWMRAKPGELQICRTFRRLAILTPILRGDLDLFRTGLSRPATCRLIVTPRASSLPSIEIVNRSDKAAAPWVTTISRREVCIDKRLKTTSC